MNPNNDQEHHHHHHGEEGQVLHRLSVATGLCATFLIVEVIGGYLSGSLAVLSDAAHLLADLTAFAVAILAAHVSSMPSSSTHTYGLKRVESLAALLSMVSLAIVSVWLAYEAIRRLTVGILLHNSNSNEVTQVDGKLMSGIAGIGVLVNVALACILGPEHHVHLPGASHDHHHDHDCHDEENHQHNQTHEHAHNHTHEHAHDHSNCRHESTKNTTTTTTTTLSSSLESNGNHDHNMHTYPDERSSLLCQSTSSFPSEHLHADEVDAGGCTDVAGEDVGHTHHAPTKPSAVTRNVNLHAAYIHVLGDLTQSVVVFLAGLMIWWKPGWTLVDPMATLLFCTLVFYSTLGVIRSCIAVLLEQVPPHVNWKAVHRDICQVEHVRQVHDLHIWSISQNIPVLSVHCFVDDQTVDSTQVLRDIDQVCQRYGIRHSTIQIQCGTLGECITCHREHEDTCAAPSLAAVSPSWNAQRKVPIDPSTLDNPNNNNKNPSEPLQLSI
jgi:zinc transporter 2